MDLDLKDHQDLKEEQELEVSLEVLDSPDLSVLLVQQDLAGQVDHPGWLVLQASLDPLVPREQLELQALQVDLAFLDLPEDEVLQASVVHRERLVFLVARVDLDPRGHQVLLDRRARPDCPVGLGAPDLLVRRDRLVELVSLV